ncbi:hypothetical protein BB559_007203 [Furculomyces boomerangus]|uniref:RRM domain-containing protein n=1 Tax=Furculomyces boomerangus TaxID=61424 RepID=A0A2T9XYJ0_9FUNG|nr:hypothetical protein BB559_007203 [Furculomyces boomerangus]
MVLGMDLDYSENDNCIYIKNFSRPLMLTQVHALVDKYGEKIEFWMDSIKSHCYVKYKNYKDAVEAVRCIQGIRFPSEERVPLECGVINIDKFNTFLKAEHQAALDGARTILVAKDGNVELTTKSSNKPINAATNKGNMGAVSEPTTNKNQNGSSHTNTNITKPHVSNRNIPNKTHLLKTKTRPHLYYLPLTEEQIQAKKKAKTAET